MCCCFPVKSRAEVKAGAKNSWFAKFPQDIVRCEKLTNGDEKILENDKSVENHNLIHKEELEGIKFSNDMKDVQKTICHICKNPLAVSRMREHTKRQHNVHITEYKLRYNIANDRCYELVERVFHRCAICSHPFPLDSDLVAGHIRKHKITHANYNAKYMVIKKNDPGISHKRKSKVKEPPKAPEIEPTKTMQKPDYLTIRLLRRTKVQSCIHKISLYF